MDILEQELSATQPDFYKSLNMITEDLIGVTNRPSLV